MTDYLPQYGLPPGIAPKKYRWLAALIDYAIWCGCCISIFMLFGERIFTEGSGVYEMSGRQKLTAFTIWLLLLPVMEGATGQTIGKAMFSIKTVNLNGGKAGIGSCIVRHMLDVVDYLPVFGVVGLIVAAGNKLNRRVGDLIAKTVVVSTK